MRRRGTEALQGADPGGKNQQPANLAVDRGLGELASADGGHQRLSPCSVWAGHYQGLGGTGGSERPDRGPVADHGAYSVDAVNCPVS